MTPIDPKLTGIRRPGSVGSGTALGPSHIPVKPGSFQKALETELSRDSIRFSAHAQQRLSQCRTELSSGQIDKLNDAVSRAENKGARESLILMDNLALVVSIRNRTVITVVDGQRIKENIFTNIDSAVIV